MNQRMLLRKGEKEHDFGRAEEEVRRRRLKPLKIPAS